MNSVKGAFVQIPKPDLVTQTYNQEAEILANGIIRTPLRGCIAHHRGC
jgi:hypothetical protein